jgi:hypothetical protein
MDLKPYSLEIEALDLGDDVRAVGIELIETGSREPTCGPEAAQIWSAIVPAIAGREVWALDFFSHLDRVREYCREHAIEFRDGAGRCVVVPQPEPEALAEMLARFEGETFGARAGSALEGDDVALEGDLLRRGVDAYHTAYPRYTFCLVCDLKSGMATLLSQSLWASEVIRRVRPAVERMDVMVSRPQ